MLWLRERGPVCDATKAGYNTWDTDLFRLKRLGLRDAGNISGLLVMAIGVWDWLRSVPEAERRGLHKLVRAKPTYSPAKRLAAGEAMCRGLTQRLSAS